MTLTPEQECDAVRFLAPLVESVARNLEFKWGRERGSLLGVVWLGAVKAVRRYDGTTLSSLWGFAALQLPRYAVDIEREETGRIGGGRAATNGATPLGLFRSTQGDHDAVTGDGGEHYLPPFTESGYAEVEARETVNVILGAVSPMHREILEARYLGGVSATELAERFGIDPTTMATFTTEALSAARRVAA